MIHELLKMILTKKQGLVIKVKMWDSFHMGMPYWTTKHKYLLECDSKPKGS
jgi:hypothetical protein